MKLNRRQVLQGLLAGTGAVAMGNVVSFSAASAQGASDIFEELNRFAPQLMTGLLANDKGDNGNVVISPLNVTRAMVVLMQGAEDNTKVEMARITFGYPKTMPKAEILEDVPHKIEKFLQGYIEIINGLGGQVKANTAIGLWANSHSDQGRISIDPAYKKFLKTKAGGAATIETLNFSDPATPEGINRWADKATDGDIKKIVGDLEASDVAVMALSLMVDGKWIYRFGNKGKVTQQKIFKGDNGQAYETPMMKVKFGKPNKEEKILIEEALKARGLTKPERPSYNSDGDAYERAYGAYDKASKAYNSAFTEERAKLGIHESKVRYQEADDYVAFRLPLGKDAKGAPIDTVIVKPKQGTAEDLYKKYAAKGKQMPWLGTRGYVKASGVIEMPRIDLEKKSDLKKTLQGAFGASTMFMRGAWSGIFDKQSDNIGLDTLESNDTFKADENGAKASSVVVAKFGTRSVMVRPKEVDFGTLKVDGSFVTAIQDRNTGASMFESIVATPNKEMKPVGQSFAPKLRRN